MNISTEKWTAILTPQAKLKTRNPITNMSIQIYEHHSKKENFTSATKNQIGIPIVTVFDILLWQFPCFRHLMPVRTLQTSCTLTTYVETANMCPISLVVWSCSLKLHDSIICTDFSIWRFIINTSPCLDKNLSITLGKTKKTAFFFVLLENSKPLFSPGSISSPNLKLHPIPK